MEYANLLYERKQEKSSPPITNTTTKLFSVEDVKRGIKKLASGKAQDIHGLQANFFKWGAEILAPIIKRILNNITQGNFPIEWTTSIVIPLYKSGDISDPSNYRTIMVNPLLGKLFGSMMECIISTWVEKEGKREK